MLLDPIILILNNIKIDKNELKKQWIWQNNFIIKDVTTQDVVQVCKKDNAVHVIVAGEEKLPDAMIEHLNTMNGGISIVRTIEGSATASGLERKIFEGMLLARESRVNNGFFELISQIQSAPGTEEIMHVVCMTVIDMFEVDHSGFVEFDDDGIHGWKVSEVPVTNSEKEYIPVKGIPAEEQVINLGEPFTSIDVTHDERLGAVSKNLTKKGIRSILIVPVKADERVIGSFSLDTINRSREFSLQDIQRARHIASIAGMALHKRRQEETIQTLRSSLEALHQIAQFSTQFDQQGTLQAIVDLACEKLGVDIASLYTYDQKIDRFILMVGAGNKSEPNANPEQITKESSLYRLLNLPDKTYTYTEESSKDDIFNGGFTDQEEIVSSFGMKLLYENEPVGVLFINFKKVHHFKKDELTTFEQFGLQAAALIKTARLKEKSEQQLAALEGLYRKDILSPEDYDLVHTLERITIQALTSVGLKKENGVSHIATQNRGIMRFVAASSSEVLDGLRTKIGEIDLDRSEGRISVVGRTIKDGISLNVSRDDPDYLEYRPDINWQLSVPLKIGNRIFGGLSVEKAANIPFTIEQQKNLEHLAVHAELVIQHSRHMMLINSLLESGKVLSKEKSLDKSLSSIANLLLENFECDLVNIFCFDSERDEITYPSVVAGDLRVPERHANPDLRAFRGRVKGKELVEKSVLKGMRDANEDVFCPAHASIHDILRMGDFVEREGIEATAALRLLSSDNSLTGFVFLSYRKPHEFSEEEKSEIKVFTYYLAQVLGYYERYDDMLNEKNIEGQQIVLKWVKQRDTAIREYTRRISENLALIQQYLRNNQPTLSADAIPSDPIRKIRSNIRRIENQGSPPRRRIKAIVELKELVERYIESEQEERIVDVENVEMPEAQVLADPNWLRYGLKHLMDYFKERAGDERNIELRIEGQLEKKSLSILLTDLKCPFIEIQSTGSGSDKQDDDYNLTIAGGILHLFDGTLDSPSPHPTGGTTIKLSLPINQPYQEKYLTDNV